MSNLYLYNSLTKQKELFTPIDANNVRMYVCGPTVYDRPHIGNARSVVIYDVLYRLLTHLYGNNNITYIRNITDIDDKINNRAKALGVTIKDLTTKTIAEFNDDMGYLHCLKPNHEPKATESISEIVELIDVLINKGYAYESNKHVYFEISKAKNYASIAGRKIEDLLSGARIDVEKSKKHPGDFVLWKPASKEDDTSSIFESPWGDGRPGWHIECSAMSHKYLGTDFDIHGGGVDLIFPHHSNEIAQSCSAHDNSKYARYWIHNGFLTVEGDKMSKSLGNFYTVDDLRKNEIKGEVLRLMLLSCHYRKPLDYNQKALLDAKEFLGYLYRSIKSCSPKPSKPNKEFIDCLADDMNFAEAFAIIHKMASAINKTTDQDEKDNMAGELMVTGQIVGIMNSSSAEWFGVSDDSDIEKLIEDRKLAKQNKDWSKADKIRGDLELKGIILEDLAEGKTIWHKKI